MRSDIEARNRVLRLNEVREKIGLSRSTIYDKLNRRSPRYDAKFPRPIKLGMSAVGWQESAIDQWLEERIASVSRIDATLGDKQDYCTKSP